MLYLTNLLGACSTYTNGIWKGVCNDGTGNGIASVAILLSNVINLLMNVSFVLAVSFIMYGGFKYVTSSGNDKGVESAKQTITYAIIGLLVTITGKMLVLFVLSRISAGQ